MVALTPGSQAPAFELKTHDGGRADLKKALAEKPLAVLAYFKVSCPVCQLAFPYLERLHRAYPTIPLWGVSQDDVDATTAFTKMFGCSFPMALDDALDNTVSYGLTNVPSIFAIDRSGNIVQTIVGFDKAELEALNERMAKASGTPVKPLFTDADEVPAFKPG